MKGASNSAESSFPCVVASANSSKISMVCTDLNPSFDYVNCDSVFKREAGFSSKSTPTLQDYAAASPHYASVAQ